MLHDRQPRRRWLALLQSGVVAALGVSLGCQSGHCLRYPDYSWTAVPPPPGTYVNRWIAAHDDRAEEIDFVIHQHEWYQDGAKLGPEGRRHVQVLALRLPTCPHMVMIEPHTVRIRSGEELDAVIQRGRELDQRRRQYVVEALLEAGVADADARVIIEYPPDEGLLGEEAPRLHQQNLQSGQQRGGTFGGFGTGLGGRGFGGRGGSGFGGFGSGGFF